MSIPIEQVVVTVLVTLLGSSGFWAVLQNHRDKRSATSKMILGLAHDKILELGEQYIAKGYITMDEYENLSKYLYAPYKEMGGNGAAERIMTEISKLPIKPSK